MIPFTIVRTSLISFRGFSINLSWTSDPLINPGKKKFAACFESSSCTCTITSVNRSRNYLVLLPYLCSRCKFAMVIRCKQLPLYCSKNIRPNCLKLWINPSGSWLNQFRARSIKVVANNLQVNPSVIFSNEAFYLNCKTWEIRSDFPWNFSNIGGLKVFDLTSLIIHWRTVT